MKHFLLAVALICFGSPAFAGIGTISTGSLGSSAIPSGVALQSPTISGGATVTGSVSVQNPGSNFEVRAGTVSIGNGAGGSSNIAPLHIQQQYTGGNTNRGGGLVVGLEASYGQDMSFRCRPDSLSLGSDQACQITEKGGNSFEIFTQDSGIMRLGTKGIVGLTMDAGREISVSRSIAATGGVSVATATITLTQSPASGAACTAGEITWDASYIYVCTASAAWKRAALTGGY